MYKNLIDHKVNHKNFTQENLKLDIFIFNYFTVQDGQHA